MNQDQVVFYLNAMSRQISFMSKTELERHLKNDSFSIEFTHFGWSEKKSKVDIKIKMREIALEKEEKS